MVENDSMARKHTFVSYGINVSCSTILRCPFV